MSIIKVTLDELIVKLRTVPEPEVIIIREENSDSPIKKFERHPHIIDQILQHLRFDDWQNLSLLNQFHREFVLTSKTFLGSSQFVMKDKDSIDFIMSRKRKYYNIKLLEIDDLIELHLRMFIRAAGTKSFEIERKDFSDYLLEFCLAEEVTLKNVERITRMPERVDPLLKKLKKLTIYNSPINFMEYIRNKEALKSFSITNPNYLSLQGIKGFHFEEIHVSDQTKYNFEEVKVQLDNFLQKHSGSLKMLTLDVWAGVPVLHTIFKMPNLIHLSLFELAKADPTTVWDAEEFTVNPSIQVLHLQDLKDNNKMLEAFLKACPNIVELKVHKLDEDAKKIVYANAKAIKILQSEM